MKITQLKRYSGRQAEKRKRRRLSPIKILTIAGAVVALLSATILLVRDAKNLGEAYRPTEGSLIVNINTASRIELISVPGIGSTRAAQIIAGRPYETVDELAKIAGISGKTLESLRPFVVTEGDTRPFEHPSTPRH